MGTFFVYLQLELKRTIKNIPYVLTGAIVLVLLAGTIAFSAANILYGESNVGMIRVGVVIPEEDVLAEKVVRMIESLDSVGSLCEFTYLSEEQGMRGLKKGDYFALMKVPQGLVEGIMDGTNIPAVIVFPESSGLEASVFRELTEAGSSILSTSQAGIYAADGYLYEYGQAVYVPKAEEDLNRIFLSYALDRETYFQKETVSASGDVGVMAHFAVAAAVLVMLLFGITAAPLLRPMPAVLMQKLSLAGVGRVKRLTVRFFSLSVMMALLGVVPLAVCMGFGYIEMEFYVLLLYLMICMTAAGWILMFYELCRNTTTSILALFFSTVVMMFMAGGIVPSVFLPEQIRLAGAWMPAAFMMEGLRSLITGQNISAVVMKLLAALAVCLGISAVFGRKEC